MAMARDGRPKKNQNIVLCMDQRAALDLIAARTPGTPPLSGLIRTAIDEFIAEQIRRNPDLEIELNRVRTTANSNVVPIRAMPSAEKRGK